MHSPAWKQLSWLVPMKAEMVKSNICKRRSKQISSHSLKKYFYRLHNFHMCHFLSKYS
jgi:hypothetical protein